MRILVVDDEAAMLEVLSQRLESWGHQVETAADGELADAAVTEGTLDLVLTDVVMPGASGLELLRRLRDRGESCPVVLVTAHGSIDLAVSAMKEGAFDFITKPIQYDRLKSILDAVEKAQEVKAAWSEDSASNLEGDKAFGPFVGADPKMKEVYRLIEAAARSDAAVLIVGESGTGKELAARSIHELSARSARNFIAVNASAIPAELMESEILGHEKGAFTGAVEKRPGCFELAHEGTLLLDEIGEMPLELQPKLLRVLEDGRVRRLGGNSEFEFDVRVISATNRQPQEAIQEGRLREDLFYRLNVLNIVLPPLRDRMSDLELLVQYFIDVFALKYHHPVTRVSAAALKRLRSHSWPGNVRELRNVLERAVVLCSGSTIEECHLPDEFMPRVGGVVGDLKFPAGITAAEAEKQLILHTLERVGFNKAEAARQLGLDVKTIRNKLKAYGLS